MTKILAVLALFLAAALPSAAATFDGFLYSKLQAVGSRSEGPGYFLQLLNGGPDTPIRKRTMLWQDDPQLQSRLGTKVTIEGELVGGTIEYRLVGPFQPKRP